MLGNRMLFYIMDPYSILTHIKTIQAWADSQHQKIFGTFELCDLKTIRQAIAQIGNVQKELEITCNKLGEIKREVSNRMNARVSIFRKQFTNPEYDIRIPRPISVTEFAPGIEAIGVTTVNTLDDIPDVRLFWVSSIHQFAIRICGLVIRGNIGEIYQTLRNNRNVRNTIQCRHGKQCRIIGRCGYYHDPVDIPEDMRSGEIRNYTNGSWVYTSESLNEKNRMMRHIGNRSTLSTDMISIADSEVSMWNDQTIHCLLVSMVLHMHR
jgi:hypothetical protein